MDAPAAMQTLKWLGEGTNRITKVIDVLNRVADRKNILDLYRVLWPSEYKRENGTIEDIMRAFYGRVERELPIADYDWEEAVEADGEDWFPEWIPFYSITPYPFECVDDWESLSAKMIHALWRGSVYGEGTSFEELQESTGVFIPRVRCGPPNIGGRIKEIRRSVKGGGIFQKAFWIINHDSDNFFVDNEEEDMCNMQIRWSVEEIRSAKKRLGQAERLFQEAKKICEEYDRDLARFARLLKRIVFVWTDGGNYAG
jgi:hypothetical protein